MPDVADNCAHSNDGDAPRRFRVAISYPGERRGYVGEVADLLAAEFGRDAVLYDQYHEAEFARPDLDVYLPALYRDEADLIVVFLCSDYAEKRWCQLEWRHLRQLIATADQGRIMFVSFEEMGGIPELGILAGDGYLAVRDRPPAEIAAAILERLGRSSVVATPAKPSTAKKKQDSEAGPMVELTAGQMLLLFFGTALLALLAGGVSEAGSRVLWSLTAAIGTFGFLASVARVENRLGRFGGAAAVFMAVFALMGSGPAPFTMTVFLRSEQDSNALVLDGAHRLLMDLGGDRRSEDIDSAGKAVFAGIPGRFRGRKVLLNLRSDSHELAEPDARHELKGESLYVAIRPRAAKIFGRIQDPAENPIAGASISGAGQTTKSDADGRFELSLNQLVSGLDVSVKFRAANFISSSRLLPPNTPATEAVITLQPTP